MPKSDGVCPFCDKGMRADNLLRHINNKHPEK